jgi:hypothetical protein
MLESFVSNGLVYGEPSGEETVNEIDTRHYTIDVNKTKTVAIASGTKSFAEMAAALEHGNLYLAADGDYVVRFEAGYAGKLNQFGLDGKLAVAYDLVSVNQDVVVELPAVCENALNEEDTTPGPVGESEQLVVKPISETVEVESLKSVVKMDMDGKDAKGKALKGDVTIEMIQNDIQEQQAIVMEGKLMTVLMDQPSLDSMGLSRIGMYKLADTVYIHLQSDKGGTNMCVKSTDDSSTEAFKTLSPESMIGSLAASEDIYGRYIGDDTINDIEVKHYELDADATNAAMQKSKNADVRRYSKTQRLVSGEVYLAKDGDYLVRLSALYEGEIKQFKFKGNAEVTFDLAELNSGIQVELPQACENPIE